jgi:hypothetical protein
MAPDRGLSTSKQSGVKGKKTRLTYAFTANADGSDKLEAFIIGKAARPRAFQKNSGAQLGFYYRSNAKAWMTAQLYQDWIRQWDKELEKKKRKILLLQDNFSGHIVPPGLKAIHVENFQPNLTAHVQPNDQGIIRCFKAHYRARFIQRAINRYDEGVTPAEIYEINQLQAMRMAESAWRDVDTTTIRNCWHKAGILPEMPTSSSHATQPSIPISFLVHNANPQVDPLAHAEKEVENALDDLQSRGVLHRDNRMDIESLLNPQNEIHITAEASDKDIYEAIIDAIEARENIGGDDVDNDGPVKPRPSHRDVLKAVSIIMQYISELNIPLARKIEASLSSLTRLIHKDEARSMKNTVLTDFFQQGPQSQPERVE